LVTLGATVGREEKILAAGRAATEEDQPAIGAHLGSGEEFHPAFRAGKGEGQIAFRAAFRVGPLFVWIDRRAAAGT
jgi:hypothetical protein